MAKLSEYRIVLGQHATFTERRSAEFLQNNVKLVTGNFLPLVTDDTPAAETEIVVGITNRETPDGIDFARNASRLWEYEVRLVGKRLYLVGLGLPPVGDGTFHPYRVYNDGAYGTGLAVYRFVEEVLGYNFTFSPFEPIPQKTADSIEIDEKVNFSYTVSYLSSLLPEKFPGKTVLYSLPVSRDLHWNMTSFILKTAGGKFVIIDGGRYNEAEHVLQVLEHLAGGEKPVITAWFFSHMHSDHFGVYFTLCKNKEMRDRIKVEHVYSHLLPEEFYTKIASDAFPEANIARTMIEHTDEYFEGAVHHYVMPHDKIVVDDCSFEVLHVPEMPPEGARMNMNDSSTVFKMTWNGEQTVMFLGDAERFCDADLIANFKDDLPSDLVQVGHHGCGNVSKECYRLINAKRYLFQVGVRFWYQDNGEGYNTYNVGLIRTRMYLKEIGAKTEHILRDTNKIATFVFPMDLS